MKTKSALDVFFTLLEQIIMETFQEGLWKSEIISDATNEVARMIAARYEGLEEFLALILGKYFNLCENDAKLIAAGITGVLDIRSKKIWGVTSNQRFRRAMSLFFDETISEIAARIVVLRFVEAENIFQIPQSKLDQEINELHLPKEVEAYLLKNERTPYFVGDLVQSINRSQQSDQDRFFQDYFRYIGFDRESEGKGPMEKIDIGERFEKALHKSGLKFGFWCDWVRPDAPKNN
ncbi:MAG: hypothetical protein HYT39_03550 [Candidatus Sungbacteria bacterium]|nr:hypothetical protein [Candidatus Sungbacteria bacterium]